MEQKVTTVSLAVKDDKYYADNALYQWNYGQILQIIDAELPMAVEVGFSTTEKQGDSDVRVGTTDNGVTTVAIPNKLFKEERSTDYSIYAFVYVTDEDSGTTVHEIVIPVKARAKQGDPSEDPTIDPSIFKDAVNAVNASANRAEAAEKSAKESAAKAKGYAESAEKSKEDVENARDNAITSIGTAKESALRGIASKTNESVLKIQRQTEESQNSIKQSIADATKKKTELDGAINNATDAKGNLDKAVQSAGNAKSELDASVGKAGEAKTALDSSISSAGEQKLALDITVEQANTVDASLKEQIGSAEQIQANVEQIAKNKADISSLNEDLAEVQDKKITKFYASNQGEMHLADSDNGKIQDMVVYGKSSQNKTTGKNLLKIKDATQTTRGVTITSKDGIITVNGTATETGWAILEIDTHTLADGTYIVHCEANNNNNNKAAALLANAKWREVIRQNAATALSNAEISKVCFTVTKDKTYNMTDVKVQLELGSSATSYEPYTGGIPSPNPDYPQEIKSVVNPTIKVCGKNLFKVIQGGYISNNDGSIYPSKEIEMGATGFININNRDITVVGKKFNTSVQNAYAFRIGFYDAKKNWIKNIVLADDRPYNINSFKVTNAEYIRVSVPSGIYDTIQIEKGSEATSYEPYHEQTVQLPYTLNAIPVASGGNVTIDGQQYITDRVVEKDGVFGIERNIREIHTNTKTMNNSEEYPGWNNVEGISDVTYYNEQTTGTSRILTFISNFTQSTLCKNNIKPNNIVFLRRDAIGYSQSELITKAIDVDMYIRLQDAIFEPLPVDIQAKLRTLVTNYPVTNVSITSDQLDGYTVFNYPISIANGWNYVKQQLNDNRDYIYDMDTKTQDIDLQSAEAYVNSEYAVALTELEV